MSVLDSPFQVISQYFCICCNFGKDTFWGIIYEIMSFHVTISVHQARSSHIT